MLNIMTLVVYLFVKYFYTNNRRFFFVRIAAHEKTAQATFEIFTVLQIRTTFVRFTPFVVI
jgi:hypothetical protein